MSILLQKLFGRLVLDPAVLSSVPSPRSLGRMEGRNGLSTDNIVAVDSRTIVLNNLNFKGLAPGKVLIK